MNDESPDVKDVREAMLRLATEKKMMVKVTCYSCGNGFEVYELTDNQQVSDEGFLCPICFLKKGGSAA